MSATLEKTKSRMSVDTDHWAAHNASSHIPNAETARAIEDALAGRNIVGVFTTGEEAVDAMLAAIDRDFIDPADYANDTEYINAIPGMREKILEGLNTPLSECEDVPEECFNV